MWSQKSVWPFLVAVDLPRVLSTPVWRAGCKLERYWPFIQPFLNQFFSSLFFAISSVPCHFAQPFLRRKIPPYHTIQTGVNDAPGAWSQYVINNWVKYLLFYQVMGWWICKFQFYTRIRIYKTRPLLLQVFCHIHSFVKQCDVTKNLA